MVTSLIAVFCLFFGAPWLVGVFAYRKIMRRVYKVEAATVDKILEPADNGQQEIKALSAQVDFRDRVVSSLDSVARDYERRMQSALANALAQITLGSQKAAPRMPAATIVEISTYEDRLMTDLRNLSETDFVFLQAAVRKVDRQKNTE